MVDSVQNTWYYSKSDIDKFVDNLKLERPIKHFKGDPDSQRYFNIDGKIFPAEYDNWYKFVSQTFFDGNVYDWMLE